MASQIPDNSTVSSVASGFLSQGPVMQKTFPDDILMIKNSVIEIHPG